MTPIRMGTSIEFCFTGRWDSGAITGAGVGAAIGSGGIGWALNIRVYSPGPLAGEGEAGVGGAATGDGIPGEVSPKTRVKSPGGGVNAGGAVRDEALSACFGSMAGVEED